MRHGQSQTQVARETGWIKQEGRSPVTIMGPMVGQITTYHHEGLSNKELWRRRKAHAECVKREFRL